MLGKARVGEESRSAEVQGMYSRKDILHVKTAEALYNQHSLFLLTVMWTYGLGNRSVRRHY
jgi:hypothetical protein